MSYHIPKNRRLNFSALMASIYDRLLSVCRQAGAHMGGQPNPSSGLTVVGFDPTNFNICMLKEWRSNQLSHFLLVKYGYCKLIQLYDF